MKRLYEEYINKIVANWRKDNLFLTQREKLHGNRRIT
jgi:hypothetical protein